MTGKDRDVLVSGKTSFKVEVPYLLIETGEKGEKPLIIYLHGFGENIDRFRQKCDSLLNLNAYHLFIQGPYPIYDRCRKKNVSDWGRAWYLYDGNRGQFIKSLELASEFIQEIVDKLLPVIQVNRIGVMGYSMGGYLAGYFALTRWKHVNDLAVIGARIKTEILNDNWENIQHLNIAAFHGKNDDKVKAEPQAKEIELLRENGVKAELNLLNENHSFSEVYLNQIIQWFKRIGYEEV
jgi:predicted esterase